MLTVGAAPPALSALENLIFAVRDGSTAAVDPVEADFAVDASVSSFDRPTTNTAGVFPNHHCSVKGQDLGFRVRTYHRCQLFPLRVSLPTVGVNCPLALRGSPPSIGIGRYEVVKIMRSKSSPVVQSSPVQ